MQFKYTLYLKYYVEKFPSQFTYFLLKILASQIIKFFKKREDI